MGDSTENISSTAGHSFSGTGDGNASEESGWTSYIDYFMETQRRRKEASCAALSTDDVGSSSTSQSGDGVCAVGGSSRLPALVEPSSEASRRLSLKKETGRRTKEVMYDDSLEDTATSPIRSPKLIELRESGANYHKKVDARRDQLSHYKKATAAAELAGYNNPTNNGTNTVTGMIHDDWA